jgi:hydroxyacylglutathione hydrolase
MEGEQYVCVVCGFNMIGGKPDRCPFCGAGPEKYLTADECSSRYHVQETPVNDRVTRLNSVPPLGIEHAAYRIETPLRTYWVDCPSSFDQELDPVDVILFTHHHFLGASNLYRKEFAAETHIHRLDSAHELCREFTFDVTFRHDFESDGIHAFHIGGHTPGFTFYIFEDVLLICDYVFLKDGSMMYNPFGPADETVAGGERIAKILEGRDLATVCGYNYVTPYAEWREKFMAGPLFVGH